MKFVDEPAVSVDSAVTRRPVCKGCTAAAGHASTTLIGKLCSLHMYIDAWHQESLRRGRSDWHDYIAFNLFVPCTQLHV